MLESHASCLHAELTLGRIKKKYIEPWRTVEGEQAPSLEWWFYHILEGYFFSGYQKGYFFSGPPCIIRY